MNRAETVQHWDEGLSLRRNSLRGRVPFVSERGRAGAAGEESPQDRCPHACCPALLMERAVWPSSEGNCHFSGVTTCSKWTESALVVLLTFLIGGQTFKWGLWSLSM